MWALFVLQGLAVAIFSLGRPAMSSLTPRLVPDDEIAAASALSSVYNSLAAVGGPAVGGLLIAAAGVPWTYGIDLVTYVASFVVIWLLPKLPPLGEVDRPSLSSILDGLPLPAEGARRCSGSSPSTRLRWSSACRRAVPGARAAQPRWQRGHRRVPVRRPVRRRARRLARLRVDVARAAAGLAVTIAACTWGAAIAAFGFMTALWPALVLLAVAGGADFFSAVLRSTMLLRATPDHLRGRLSGIEFTQVASAPNLGDLEAGVLASLTSLRFSIVSGGVFCVVGCIATALALPGFLKYDSREPQT